MCFPAFCSVSWRGFWANQACFHGAWLKDAHLASAACRILGTGHMSRMFFHFPEGCSVYNARFGHVYDVALLRAKPVSRRMSLDNLLQKRHWNPFMYFGICGDPAARFEGMAFYVGVQSVNIDTKQRAKLSKPVRFWETAQAQKQNKHAHNGNVFPRHNL